MTWLIRWLRILDLAIVFRSTLQGGNSWHRCIRCARQAIDAERNVLAKVKAVADAWIKEADSLCEYAPIDGTMEVVNGKIIGGRPNEQTIASRKSYAYDVRRRAQLILDAIGINNE